MVARAKAMRVLWLHDSPPTGRFVVCVGRSKTRRGAYWSAIKMFADRVSADAVFRNLDDVGGKAVIDLDNGTTEIRLIGDDGREIPRHASDLAV